MWPSDLTMPMEKQKSYRNACITLFDFKGKVEELVDSDKVRYAIWSTEKCATTGSIHVQMYMETKTAYKLPGWKKLVGEITGDEKAHIEARKGTREEARNYCMKEDTHVAGPWEFGKWVPNGRPAMTPDEESIRVTLDRIDSLNGDEDAFFNEDPVMYLKHHKLIRQYVDKKNANEVREMKKAKLREMPLYPWQSAVLEKVLTMSNRGILWVWEGTGNVGKSHLLQYMRLFHGACNLGGQAKDAKYIYKGEPIVCFDIARTQQEFMGGLFSFVEELKNGEFMSGKYRTTFKEFVPPAVVFFANFPPEDGKWSADRLEVFHIDEWMFKNGFVPGAGSR